MAWKGLFPIFLLCTFILSACTASAPASRYDAERRVFVHPDGFVLSLPPGWKANGAKEEGSLFQAVYPISGALQITLVLRTQDKIPSLKELVALEQGKPDALRIGAPLGILSDLTLLHAGPTTWSGREAEEALWLADQKGVRIFVKQVSAVAGLTAFQIRFQVPTLAFDSSSPTLQQALNGVQWRPRSPQPREVVSAYRETGKSFIGQKRYADAIRVYQDALDISPRDASIHLLLADAARQAKELDLSERAYREAIRLRQNDPHPYQGLAEIMLERKNPSGAIRLLQEAIPLAPQDASLRSDLGRSLLAAGKPKEALDNFKKAIRRDRKLAEARVGLAQAYRATGEMDLAVNAYRDALRIKPSLKEIHCELERIYQLQEFTAEAEAERKLCPAPEKDTTLSSPSNPDDSSASPQGATP